MFRLRKVYILSFSFKGNFEKPESDENLTYSLKERNLIITGFNCVERGVTFNFPDFQFFWQIQISETHCSKNALSH